MITNIGTQLFAMLPEFEKDSEEYKEVLNRLKICNCFQSMEIDRAKGIKTMDIPRYWTKWAKISGKEDEEELKVKQLHRNTIADKRPYFFRYLYQTYNKQYNDHRYIYNDESESLLGITLEDLESKKERSEEEEACLAEYKKYSPLLDSQCVMNKIAHYCEEKVKDIKVDNKEKSFDYKLLFLNVESFTKKHFIIIDNIHKKYKQYKKSINYQSSSSGYKDMMRWLNQQSLEAFPDVEETLYWAFYLDTSFLLDVYGKELVSFLSRDKGGEIMIPIREKDGYIEYMGSLYGIEKVQI